MQLTSGQDKAIKKLVMWYKMNNSQQVFSILGYGGTGKTTIIYQAMEQLGIKMDIDVKFVTFTGKAAMVMRKKMVPATTIHQLIYDTMKMTVPEVDDKGNPVLLGDTPKLRDAFKTVLKGSLPHGIKLIVVDEVSMVSQKIWDDLLSFGIKIVVLGDPGYLIGLVILLIAGTTVM